MEVANYWKRKAVRSIEIVLKEHSSDLSIKQIVNYNVLYLKLNSSSLKTLIKRSIWLLRTDFNVFYKEIVG